MYVCMNVCQNVPFWSTSTCALYANGCVFVVDSIEFICSYIVTKLIYYYQYMHAFMHSRGREYHILICA